VEDVQRHRSLPGTYTLEEARRRSPCRTASRRAPALTAARGRTFQSGATVAFELAREGEVSLEVYDLTAPACARWPPAAGRRASRSALDGRGGMPAAPGIYFVRFRADGVASTRRLVKLD